MGEPQEDKRLPEVLNRRSPDQPFRDNITAPLREMQTNILASPLTSHWAGKKMAWPFRSTIERAITQNSGEWKREKQFDILPRERRGFLPAISPLRDGDGSAGLNGQAADSEVWASEQAQRACPALRIFLAALTSAWSAWSQTTHRNVA